jgi:hypothetical protein
MTRESICDRLSQLCRENGNFEHGFRFRNATFHGRKLSEIPYGDYQYMEENFTDDELVQLFEFVCYRYYKQG